MRCYLSTSVRFVFCMFVSTVFAFGNTSSARASNATFEDVTLTGDFDNGDPGGLTPGNFHNGSYTSGGLGFNNQFNQGNGFSFWSGWSTSKVTDITTAGFGNEYAAYHVPGGGTGDASSQYGIAFGNSALITAPVGEFFQSMRITNNTYAALSMLNGDAFAKKFGGASGNDADFFKIIITGKQGGVGGTTVGTIDFYLADYRFANNALDYIIDEWTTVDLTLLVGADALTFDFESTDVGSFGINTPTYFAADNIVTAVPEPSSLSILLITGLLSIGMRRKRQQKVCR